MLTAMSLMGRWGGKNPGHGLIRSDQGLIDLASSRHEVLSLLDMGSEESLMMPAQPE
jgi:hypothetical protein